MANFDIEFEKIILAEGGYVNDKNDAGGETYLGVSRKNNPNWAGWKIIDSIKKRYGTKNITARLKKDNDLTEKVKLLYRINYWNPLHLDEVPSQSISRQLFDTCVNCGFSTAVRTAQIVCGMTSTGKWSEELLYNLINYGED